MKVRTTIADDAANNINAAQKKQKRDYDRRLMFKTEIKVDDIMLLKKQQTIWSKGWEVFTKMTRSLHCYEYLWQRSCDFKKRIGSDS